MINNTSKILNFPFLGSKEDGESFEYLLISINKDCAEIAIPDWLVNRTKLYQNEKINLYIPRQINVEYVLRDDISGIISSIEHNNDIKSEIYRVAFSKQIEDISLENMYFDQFALMPSPNSSLTQLMIKLVKDSMLLKSGIRVYFKHLIPYFSRIVNYSEKEYFDFKKLFLQDIVKHIRENESKLKEFHISLEEKLTKEEEIPVYVDLEVLRQSIESEVSLPIFNIAFSEKETSFLEQFQIQSQYAYSNYLSAIKNLEKRLYSNYNLIVIIYLKSLH